MKERKPVNYAIEFARPGEASIELLAEHEFRLDEQNLSDALRANLSTRERDFLRVAMGIYTVDRALRRNSRGGLSRIVRLSVDLCEPGFWREPGIVSLLQDAVQQVSDDCWDFEFRQSKEFVNLKPYLGFRPDSPLVCLYSGGLDSAAGLATRLRLQPRPVVTVTAFHQPGQKKRVREQVQRLGHKYGVHTYPLIVKTSMVNAPALSKQETSQRCRSILFLGTGGVAASMAGASEVEVYENGVGAVNLPLMAGMIVGSRATKGCHPKFLRTMSDLLSKTTGRRIDFVLPFRHRTKAEIVRTLADDGLKELARATVSCVHFPLRVPGPAKQCGCCPGCIGRRQALIAAGISENPEQYKYDLFGRPSAVNAIPAKKIVYLKAMVMQIAELLELQDDGHRPDIFRRHVFGTGILGEMESVRPWVDILRRYRQEWIDLVRKGQREGWNWAKWLSIPSVAA